MSQGIIFSAQFNAVSISAQVDLFEINVPATGVVFIHEINVSQSTLKGDAAEVFWNLILKSGATTSGSGGSTPTAFNAQGATYAGTIEANNTTKATGGTITTRRGFNWNVRSEFVQIYTPETRPRLQPSGRGILELATTPGVAVTTSGLIVFEFI